MDHNILNSDSPLKHFWYFICDLALFLGPYLHDRIQVVTVNEVKASPSLLTCGGPPGLSPGTNSFPFVYSASF